MRTNEKALDETDATDHENDTTLVAIILPPLAVAMTMAIEVTTAPIVMTESIVSTVMVMTVLFLATTPPTKTLTLHKTRLNKTNQIWPVQPRSIQI